jgi:hypothetical protein
MKTIEDLINELEEKCREEGREFLLAVATNDGDEVFVRGNRQKPSLLKLCNIAVYTIVESILDEKKVEKKIENN